MAKAAEYLYVKRWGLMMGSNRDYIAQEQARAAAAAAPLTAIYHRDDQEGWRTIEGVSNESIRHYFTSRGWMTPEWTVPDPA